MAIKSVKVPHQLEAIFVNAEESIANLFKNMVSNPAKGTIEINGERYLLVRAASLSYDFYNCIMGIYRDKEKHEATNVTRQLLYDISHAIGKEDAKYFSKTLNLKNPIEKLSAGPVHFAYTGWAFVDILPESNPSQDESFVLIYEHPYSFESASWISAGKKSDVPICIMNAGYSSGWCEESFGIPLVATEITCKAKGDEACLFVMAHPSHIENHLKDYLEQQELATNVMQYKIPEFFSLKIAEEELRKKNIILNQLNVQLKQQTNKLEDQKTILEKTNKTLQESEERFHMSFDFAAIGMALVSPAGRWLKVNKSLCQLVGYTEEELLELDFQTITHPDDLKNDLDHVQEILDGKMNTYQMEKRYIRKDGSIIWILLSVSVVKDVISNKPLYFIAQIQNIDAQKKAEHKLKYFAYHDSLTGLPNRKSLENLFESALKTAQQDNTKLAVYFVDLDNFKEVNDSFGHPVGDNVLSVIAKRLQHAMGDTHMIARLGGDEIIVVATGIMGMEQVTDTALNIRDVIAQPIVIDSSKISITSSIGISIYPDDARDLNNLIKYSDRALYFVKEKGRNFYKLYSDIDNN
ncbi:MAG: diguanylate cyclase [Gammaproteobacteria bacterium]|nr:diguanylate cyclase [Gammaproteobacteria bacterium]